MKVYQENNDTGNESIKKVIHADDCIWALTSPQRFQMLFGAFLRYSNFYDGWDTFLRTFLIRQIVTPYGACTRYFLMVI